jgi:hypothetical protein
MLCANCANICNNITSVEGHAVATSRNVVGSIPNEVTGFFI